MQKINSEIYIFDFNLLNIKYCPLLFVFFQICKYLSVASSILRNFGKTKSENLRKSGFLNKNSNFFAKPYLKIKKQMHSIILEI